jgi:ABC-type branched-subunit amino acid transport system permease subunit
MNLLYGYCGQISFGHAGFYAVGSYAVALFAPGTGFWLAFALGPLCAAMVAACLGVPLLRLRGHYLALGTLAFGIAIQVLALQWVDVTGGPWGVSVDRPAFFGASLGRNYYYVVLACAAVVVWLSSQLVRSRFGRAMLIIHEDEAVANSLGVNVVLVKVVIFSVSGALAGLAGGLYAGQNEYVTPALFDVRLSISAVVMVVLGGPGTRFGPVIGAVILTLLPELLHGLQEYHAIIYGILLLLVLRFMPRGIAGLMTRPKSGAAKPSTGSGDVHPAT